MRVSPQSVGIIHLIGIGGIGMSGIAEILHSLGYTTRGSDSNDNTNVERLRLLGVPVHIGQDPEHVKGAAVVVVSSAIKEDNPELKAAREMGMPIVQRAEMLAEIMRLKPSIAFAGTHGKTTTTSLAAHVFDTSGLDPTVISGGIINSYGTNARLGSGNWVLSEADESDGSFTKLPATIAVVTNIDPEHLEHYGSFDHLKQAFNQFVSSIPFYGLGVLCIDSDPVRELAQKTQDRRCVTYGFSKDADVRASNIQVKDGMTHFDVTFSNHFYQVMQNVEKAQETSKVKLSMYGEHNVLNTLAVMVCGLEVGISIEVLIKSLESFEGVARRFTQIGFHDNVTYIDDYAHHPVEISVVLETAKKIAQGKVIAIAQPHRYSRLNDLFDEFCSCFSSADNVIVLPVYAAGEAPIKGMSHVELAQQIQGIDSARISTAEDIDEILATLQSTVEPGDYVLFMGAGDITHKGREAVDRITKNSFFESGQALKAHSGLK